MRAETREKYRQVAATVRTAIARIEEAQELLPTRGYLAKRLHADLDFALGLLMLTAEHADELAKD